MKYVGDRGRRLATLCSRPEDWWTLPGEPPKLLLELDEDRASGDALSLRHENPTHERVVRRYQRRLHLHRLEEEERLPLLDSVALACEDPDDRPGHRRADHALLSSSTPGRVRERLHDGRRPAGRGSTPVPIQPPISRPRPRGSWIPRERRVLLEKRSRRPTRAHVRMRDEPAKKREVGRHAANFRLPERGSQASEGLVARLARCNHLRE